MKICPQCKMEFDEDDYNFCPHCGEELCTVKEYEDCIRSNKREDELEDERLMRDF